jgi:hypothetical protein
MHRGNTSEFAGEFKDNSFDIILFDADHSYYGVSTDFYNYENKLKNDGQFVFHDYNDGMWKSIAQFCNEMVVAKKIQFVHNIERIGVFKK